MESNRKEESRIFQKCCFCLPLRGGLLFLAYLNVIGAVISVYLEQLVILPPVNWGFMDEFVDATGINNPWIYLLPKLVDFAYGVVLLYALHKNDILVLYAYLCYSLTYISIVLYTGITVWTDVFHKNDFLFIIAATVLYQGFLAFLVRNLRVELMRKTEESANEGKSYISKQSTNDSDLESQPLPSAPKQAQDISSL